MLNFKKHLYIKCESCRRVGVCNLKPEICGCAFEDISDLTSRDTQDVYVPAVL